MSFVNVVRSTCKIKMKKICIVFYFTRNYVSVFHGVQNVCTKCLYKIFQKSFSQNSYFTCNHYQSLNEKSDFLTHTDNTECHS